LAWAITVHKSQGMSLDAALIDLSASFERGMGYVALSRVRSLQGLFLKGLNDMALKVNEEVLDIDKKFRSLSNTCCFHIKTMGERKLLEMHEEFANKVRGPSSAKVTAGKEKINTVEETKNSDNCVLSIECRLPNAVTPTPTPTANATPTGNATATPTPIVINGTEIPQYLLDELQKLLANGTAQANATATPLNASEETSPAPTVDAAQQQNATATPTETISPANETQKQNTTGLQPEATVDVTYNKGVLETIIDFFAGILRFFTGGK